MHLAVNELNASQLEAYDNMNHQLSGGITEIAKGLQQAFSTMGEGNTENMIRLFEGIVDLLEEGGKVPEGMEEGLLKISLSATSSGLMNQFFSKAFCKSFPTAAFGSNSFHKSLLSLNRICCSF